MNTTAVATTQAKTAWRLERDARETIGARVATTLYLLGNIAVDPREVRAVRAQLATGLVMVPLFGFCNPAQLFELPADSADLKRIRDAVEANIAGPMFSAAVRVLRHREPAIARRRGRQEDGVLNAMRATMTWPNRAEWDRNEAAASERNNGLCALLDAKLTAVRNRRNERLAILSRAAAPGVGSWTELLEAIAANAAGRIH